MLQRYMALVRARKELGLKFVESAAAAAAPKRSGRVRKWAPLTNMFLPKAKDVHGVSTVDCTLDLSGYQLFRDGLLPNEVKRTHVRPSRNDTLELLEAHLVNHQQSEVTELEQILERDLRRSGDGIGVDLAVEQCALVIGCDEAGRGPLAGPVVGAAVCRVPRAVLNDHAQYFYLLEPFAVRDSKSMSRAERQEVFKALTGTESVEELANAALTQHYHDRPSSSSTAADVNVDHTQGAMTVFDTIVADRSFMTSMCGVGGDDTDFFYFWSISVANHHYVDTHNIFESSLDCMHCAARDVWELLSTPSVEGDADRESPAATLARLHRSHHEKAGKDAANPQQQQQQDHCLFGQWSDQVQHPLVLMDGSHTSNSSVSYFTDIDIGGAVHPVIKGDQRSWSIAAASNLAKQTRDSLMHRLAELYPSYGFDVNKGYPVADHLKQLKKYGLSPVHRRSYKPCAALLAEAPEEVSRSKKTSQTKKSVKRRLKDTEQDK